MKKQGFTLAEMVVSIGLVAAIAVVLVPMLPFIKPNKDLLMFRKAYYRVEQAITELVNDDNLYPEPDDGSEGTYLADTSEVFYRGEAYSGNTKFCGLLAAKLSAETVSCTVNGGSFTTSDGIIWRVPITDFSGSVSMSMDINGNKGPNCSYSSDAPAVNDTPSSSCTKPDTFEIRIFSDGRIVVEGEMEKEYLFRKDTTQGAAFETMEDPNN